MLSKYDHFINFLVPVLATGCVAYLLAQFGLVLMPFDVYLSIIGIGIATAYAYDYFK